MPEPEGVAAPAPASAPAPETAHQPAAKAPSAAKYVPPRARIPTQGNAPAAEVPAPQAKGPPHCLLVDDSRMIRKVARKIIEDIGYKVAEAENGEEALAKCKIAMPDLIMLDWDMPVMTGIEFLAALRAHPTNKRPKVVFCTTKSDAFDIHKGIDTGADEYVTKPFNEASLTAKLKRIGAA